MNDGRVVAFGHRSAPFEAASSVTAPPVVSASASQPASSPTLHGASFDAAVDVVIVGSGVAGLTAALDAAAAGLHVVVITKGDPDDSQHDLGPGRDRRGSRGS